MGRDDVRPQVTHRVELRGLPGMGAADLEVPAPRSAADPYPERDTTLPVAEAITLESST